VSELPLIRPNAAKCGQTGHGILFSLVVIVHLYLATILAGNTLKQSSWNYSSYAPITPAERTDGFLRLAGGYAMQ
jgi:hypothetical protein